MEYFDYRCSPPITIVGGPQLDSICINAACPLDPHAECKLYDDGGTGVEPMTAPQCMATPTPPPPPPPPATSTYYESSSEYESKTWEWQPEETGWGGWHA